MDARNKSGHDGTNVVGLPPVNYLCKRPSIRPFGATQGEDLPRKPLIPSRRDSAVSRDVSANYPAAPFPASRIALSTLGGDMGCSRSRMPMASWIAFEIAAIGGMIGTSPMPRTP